VRTPDVLIAGAGIIALSTALDLAAHGLSVTVLEQGTAMREASWAAAGMLAARDPENPPQLRHLANLSLALYPDFLRKLEALSGLHVPLRTSLTLQGVHTSSPDAHATVPDLIPGRYSFLTLDEQSLDPRDLCRALPLAAQAAGVTLYEHTRVEHIDPSGFHVQIETSQGTFTAPHYVHCCGAWSGTPAFQRFALPVEPRKGQILTITLPPNAPTLTCVLRTPEIYLVPRGENCIVVGATVEQAGFDRTITTEATATLLAAAAALWPPILAGEVTDCWTGLRPSTPDNLPIIDQIMPGLWIATGHFRNGILLAPGTARVLAQGILGQPPAIDLEPFSAARFAAVATAS
jgi:glycine oxidase